MFLTTHMLPEYFYTSIIYSNMGSISKTMFTLTFGLGQSAHPVDRYLCTLFCIQAQSTERSTECALGYMILVHVG